MDTITQALLGGAVGFAVVGREAPRKALFWGAAIAVLPDLDVLIPYENDLEAVTRHRGWTHSWLVQTAAAPLLAWLLHRLDRSLPLRDWWLLAWLALATHSALDALTVYGTQLFWPYPSPPVMIGSVFIIDPLYSLPLLAGFLAVALLARSRRARRFNHAMLAFSTLYLLWGLAAQQGITHRAATALNASGIAPRQLLVTPTAFNTLLWRVLAIDGRDYLEGFASVMDGKKKIEMQRYPRRLPLLDGLGQSRTLKRINWFSHGYYAAGVNSPEILVRDLRMGSEPYYPFQFKLAARRNGGVEPFQPQLVRPGEIPEGYFDWLWRRIWSSEAGLLVDD
ncbi:MAG: metal-dependent hydrolase [Pseudomonadota bacterium]|nr:metal-dependent hydrolase [Pseudomonadota bacterium]